MKTKYFSLIALLGTLAACDPTIDEEDARAFYSESDLANSVEITQPYSDYPDVLSFKTSPAKFIQILDENDGVVASGISCDSFKLAPGVSGNLTIKGLSQDGKVVSTSKTITVSKYTNVPNAWYKITGNSEGSYSNATEWVWDEESNGACWGNAGYLAGPSTPSKHSGKWWGAKISELSGQLNHAVGGALTGEESADAKMVVAGGSITKYAGDGSVLAKGAFTIKDVEGNDYKVADLTTTNNTVLWPYQINGGGKYVNNFEVTYLDENYMQLIYAPAGTGAWSECTWWELKKKGVGAYVNPAPYQKWVNDVYTIVGADGKALEGVGETPVTDNKLTFSYVSLETNFTFKAKAIESSNDVKVPAGTTFVDITPANGNLFKVVGSDTTAVEQSGTTFDALEAGARYDVTVTYDSEKDKYSVYYTAFDVNTTSLAIVAHASKAIFTDANKKAVKDTVYTGTKTVSGSITTYTFENITFKDGGNEFYFNNQKAEPLYYISLDYNSITMLKGDEKVFEKASAVDGAQLIKLASTIKTPVTIVLSIYEQQDGSQVAYLSAVGAAK